MILLIPLVAHFAMSLIMLALPYMTRREILFGVVVPVDFRSSPRGAAHFIAFAGSWQAPGAPDRSQSRL